MINQKGQALTFYAFYSAGGQGVTGLPVMVDVFEGTTIAPIVSAANATELGDGLYYYTLAGAAVDANACYLCVFKTTDVTVDQQHIPALWTVPTWVANIDMPLSTLADAVWNEALAGHLGAGSTGVKLNSLCCPLGSGAVTWTYTLTDNDTGLPIAGAVVTVTTDLGGAVVVAQGTTNVFGVVTFYLDSGTYYLWRVCSGYSFLNPDTEAV
jgi:hypothetical protein